MMLVKILKFGSNWWARVGADATDPWRFTRHAAYFNSAGLQCGRKVRRHWFIPGLIRFNGIGDFNPQFPLRAVGHTFCCDNLFAAPQGNRLLVRAKAAVTAVPDYFLTVISSDRHGVVDFTDPGSISEAAIPIAVSELREKQEILILMRLTTWIQTSIGFWELTTDTGYPNGASLQLTKSRNGIRV